MTDSNDTTERRILAIVTNYGVEQDELVVPVAHLRDAGVHVTVAAARAEPIETLVGDKDPGRKVEPDSTLADIDPAGYDLLLIPGGTINADNLRLDDDAVRIVRAMAGAGRPVAAICHGPWALVEADLVTSRTLTSYPSVATDIRNAGGNWVDEPVVTDRTGHPLITSRTPDDLDDFLRAIDEVLAA